MNKQAIIERTVNAIMHLPEARAAEISTFADFIFKRHEESKLAESVQELTAEGEAFRFLEEDEEIYSLADLQEVFNG